MEWLRGAVPIIFAIMCRAAEVPGCDTMFNIVFICTLVSLVVQGTTISFMAGKLDLLEAPDRENLVQDFDFEFSEEVKSATTEIVMTEEILAKGNRLMDLGMPERTLVIMVKREEQYFVPTGGTVLLPDDKLLVISDNYVELEQTLRDLGVKIPEKEVVTREKRLEKISDEVLDIIEKLTVDESRLKKK